MDFLTKRLRRYVLSAALLLCAAVGRAVELQPVPVQDFTAGLNTTQDPTTIENGAAQDLQNVDVKDGFVTKRRGSTKQTLTTLGGFSSQAARFLHEYIDSSNNVYLLSVSSNSLFQSSDGGASNTSLTSGLGITSASRFQAVNAFGKAYLLDGTTNAIVVNGTSVSASTAIPKGTTIEFFGERILVGGVTGSASTFYAGARGSDTDFTADAGTDDDAFSTQIRQSDGYVIRCIKRFRNGVLVFKDRSIDMLTLSADGLTFIQTPISSRVGTIFPESVQSRDNSIIWLGHDGFYAFDGVRLSRISNPIQSVIEDLGQLRAAARSRTITSQTDFEAGTVGAGLSTTLSAGTVQFTTQTIDTFADGDFTASPAWTPFDISNTTVTISSNRVQLSTGTDVAKRGGIYYNYGVSTGAWTFTFNYTNAGSTGVGFKLTTDPPTAAGVAGGLTSAGDCGSDRGYFLHVVVLGGGPDALIGLSKCTSANHSVLTSAVTYPAATGTDHTVTINRTSAGAFTVKFDTSTIITATDVTYTSATYIGLIYNQPSNGLTTNSCRFDDILFNYLSAVYQSQVLTIGPDISSWSPFSVTSADNSGSHSFAIYGDTDTSININNSTTYVASQTITNGATPSLGLYSYITVADSFSRALSTFTPTLSDFTVSWNEGNPNVHPAGLFWDGDYYCALAVDVDSANDTIFIYDENGAWTKYKSLPAYIMELYRGRPYFGSNSQGDIIRFQVDGRYRDYNDSAVNAYWVSKEFDFGFPLTDKTMTRYYVTAKHRTSSTATFEWGVNRGTLTSESSGSSTYNGSLDLDSVTGFFRKSVNPTSLTFQKGLSHRFKISNSVIDEVFDLLSVTMKANLETSP